MPATMKTTLNIDDELLARAKATAARERKSLTRLIEEGLALRLRPAVSRKSRKSRMTLPVFMGEGGFVEGIDPSSNASIHDAADV
jgi:hypothetical protein